MIPRERHNLKMNLAIRCIDGNLGPQHAEQ
jgi:hypothetical protein